MAATILIIEDDNASRELVDYLLTNSGYLTLAAENGSRGLAIALAQRPDLIICDLQMPWLNGFELLRHLQSDARWRRVPVLAVSAFSMPGDREASLAAGFSAHIDKPIDAEAFVAQVEVFLPPRLRR